MLCVGPLAQAAVPGAAAATTLALSAPSEPNLLLLEVQLDGFSLAESMTAYEVGTDLLLPLGELARLLTLGITVDTQTRTASGFLLSEERSFRLELDTASVVLATGREAVEPGQLHWMDDELYVSSRLLQRWWPMDLILNLSTLSLKVEPREKLPIQLKMARERAARNLRPAGSGYVNPGYPRADADYRLLSVPFIDQTLGLQMGRSSADESSHAASYSAYITGDLLGMEASMFVNSSNAKPQPEARLTLSRFDPDATLLGPLRATALTLGNVGVPALANVMQGGGAGNGLVVGNRPLNQPSSYGLHTLRGDLPPGWDVTLYFNDALIAFQPSRPDGRYEFLDQTLVFGANEFRLVFNGPLGQSRVERVVFMLDQTLTKPDEFFYTAGLRRGDDGSSRQTLQTDFGLSDQLAVTAGLVNIKPGLVNGEPGLTRHYSNLGLRASGLGALWSMDHVQANSGGKLSELGLRSRLGRMALDLTHTRLSDNFVSDFFAASSDPVVQRTRLRLSGSVPVGLRTPLPVGLDLFRETTVSGRSSLNAQARVSLNAGGTSFTNSLSYQSSGTSRTTSGVLQISRRVAGIGLSSQLAYTLKPERKLTSVAISADKSLVNAARLNFGLLQSLDSNVTTVFGGYNRNYGSFGVGWSMRYSSTGDIGIGVQLFMSLGRDPRSGRWVQDWQPMAGMGVVSARTFVDANMNGRFDAGEEAVENAGFTLNGGSRHPVRTGPDGVAYLSRMTPKAFADLALDSGTLEDPGWQAVKPGVRLLPRPGKVLEVDFPVVMTGEIDGNVYLTSNGKRRSIGNALLELVNERGEVTNSARSGGDGYYIVPAVRSGRYVLRISPQQLQTLGLEVDRAHTLEMKANGNFINGLDFTLHKQP